MTAKNRSIRKAGNEDMGRIMELLECGREKMRANGNVEQWTEGNPKQELIENDIRSGNSYVVEESGEIIATFAFIQGPDPTYNIIYEGRWEEDTLPYYVIHRMASQHGVHGIFECILNFCFAQTNNIRIDTHRQNGIMRNALKKKGFQYCGIIYLADGAERLAYQCLNSTKMNITTDMDIKDLTIRRATINDTKHIASAFVMGVGEECAAAYCGNNYTMVLEEIVRTDNTQYNYRNVLIAELKGKVVGACIGYDGGKLKELRAHTLEVIERHTGIMPHVEEETNDGEFYIDTIGVVKEYRSKGIGRMLLSAMCEKAYEKGHKHVGLIVDHENPKAKKLYESVGFQRMEEMTFLGHKMWHMQKNNQ